MQWPQRVTRNTYGASESRILDYFIVIAVSTIAKSPLLEGVDPETVATIASALTQETWPKGRQIMAPAETTESFRLVLDGRVKIVRSNSRDGHELTLWLLGPGDGFDIVSLLDGKLHSVTAWALDDVRALSGPVSLWRDWLARHRALDIAAHRYVADRLRDLSELAGHLALHDTSTRVAHLLLRHFDAKGHNLLHDLPQRELASMIGSVRIVVSRALAQFRRHGVVELRDGTIRVVDLKRLLANAEAELAGRRVASRPSKPERR